MTIPTLISNYQKSQTVAQLKKAYSEINQAIQLAQVEHGSSEHWTLSDKAEGLARTEEFANNYLFKNLKIIKICVPSSEECWVNEKSPSGTEGLFTNEGGTFVSAITASGYAVCVHTYEDIYAPHSHIAIDLNGPTKGNSVEGKDVFRIRIGFAPSSTTKAGVMLNGAQYIPSKTREDLINNKTLGCSKSARYSQYCGALIQLDGWEIKDDYPW